MKNSLRNEIKGSQKQTLPRPFRAPVGGKVSMRGSHKCFFP